MKPAKHLTRLDWLFLILFAVGGLWLTAVSVNKPVHPAEDAAMLMRYSQHFAQGYGIVWNVGQPPVDGATDFLFMAVLAGLYALGGGLESTVLWVGGITHLLTVLLVYYGIRRYFKGGVLAAVLSAAFLSFGPGLRYTEASFGTTFFAFFCCLSWLTTQYAIEQPGSTRRAFCFALCCLLMGLTRPEGVLSGCFMALAIIFRLRWKESNRISLIFVGVFLLLGGAYFLWRWNYFGYPLPNTFYKKGGGQLYFNSLQESWKGVLELSFPFWLAFAWGIICLIWVGLNRFIVKQNWFKVCRQFLRQVFGPKNRQQLIGVCQVIGVLVLAGFVFGLFRQSSNLHETLAFGRYSAQYAGLLTALLVTGLLALSVGKWLPELSDLPEGSILTKSSQVDPPVNLLIRVVVFACIPVLGFTLMWVLLSNEMNYLLRFQYPILPIILMTWPLLLHEVWPVLNLRDPEEWSVRAPSLIFLTIILLGGGLIWSQIERWKIDYQTDGRFEVAQYLTQYADKQYTLATTEAGLLPLYSGWQALDTWGLNDSWIAHNGGLTSGYLDQIKPEIIMFHADFSPVYPRTEAGDAWSSMTLKLDIYAREHDYSLAAVYGDNPVDTHYYYVRPDFPESQEIVAFIRSLDGGGYRYGSHPLDYNKLMWKKDMDAK